MTPIDDTGDVRFSPWQVRCNVCRQTITAEEPGHFATCPCGNGIDPGRPDGEIVRYIGDVSPIDPSTGGAGQSPYPDGGSNLDNKEISSQGLTEEWRSAVGWEGLYEVSNLGRIRTVSKPGFRRVVVMKERETERGYLRVCLSRANRVYVKTIHSLVAETFIGPRPSGYHINHIDGDKKNNRYDNLEYLTHQDNVRHWVKRTRTPSKAYKLTARDARIIRALDGRVSARELADLYGVKVTAIRRVRNGTTWSYLPQSNHES